MHPMPIGKVRETVVTITVELPATKNFALHRPSGRRMMRHRDAYKL